MQGHGPATDSLERRIQEMSYFLDNNTGEIIAQGLKEALESWGLEEEREVALTADSGTNIVKLRLRLLMVVLLNLAPLQHGSDFVPPAGSKTMWISAE